MESILGTLQIGKAQSPYPVLQIMGTGGELETIGIITHVDAGTLQRTLSADENVGDESKKKLTPRDVIPFRAGSGRVMFRPKDEGHQEDGKAFIVPSDAVIARTSKGYNVYPTESKDFYLIDFDDEKNLLNYVPFMFTRNGRTFFRVINFIDCTIPTLESIEQYDIFLADVRPTFRTEFPAPTWVTTTKSYAGFSNIDWSKLEPTVYVKE